MEEIKRKIEEILLDIEPDLDMQSTALIDNQELDSFGIISLIGELREAFDINIPAAEIKPENFNSVDRLAEMVAKLQ